ncbi:hypothetical protein HDU98_001774 [Podochytrium sp. JEL0797]|nr:hypothetical protein HDU98_001774 [Podochytrium sp. JEL0797]
MVLVELLPSETAPLLFDTDMSTNAVWFFSGTAPVSFFEAKTRAMLSANPWLAGFLVKHGSRIALSFDEDADWTTRDLASLLRFCRWDLVSTDTHSHVCQTVGKVPAAIVPSGRTCLKKHLPIFSVTILSSETEFALVVSLSHAVADGANFYQISNMFSTETEPYPLQFERVETFSEALVHYMPDIATLKFTWRMQFRMFYTLASTVLSFAFRRFILNQDCFPNRVRTVPTEWINAQKHLAKSCDPTGPVISSNDVLTSHLLRLSRSIYGVMAVNMRGRIPGIHRLLVGNYESVVLYSQADFQTPSDIRASISSETGILRRVTPGPFQSPPSSFVKFGNCTNWAGLYGRDMRLPEPAGEFIRHEPMAVVSQVPMPLSLFIIFAPRMGELAVVTNDETFHSGDPFAM